MQLQLERQQVARQQLERLPRRQLQTTTVAGGGTQTQQSTVLREPANTSSSQTGTVTTGTINLGLLLNNLQTAQTNTSQNSQFLLSRLLDELSVEPAMEELRAERAMFVQQLLLSTIIERDIPISVKLKEIRERELRGECEEDDINICVSANVEECKKDVSDINDSSSNCMKDESAISDPNGKSVNNLKSSTTTE